jgi:hypothetical protein
LFRDDFDDASVDKSDDLCFEFDDGEDADEEGLLFVFKRQVRCVAHRLQLALHSAFKSDEEMKELKEVSSLFVAPSNFVRSSASERLSESVRYPDRHPPISQRDEEAAGAVRKEDSPSRPNSLVYTAHHLLAGAGDLNSHQAYTAYEFGLELISRQDLDGLGAVCELISPFRKLTEALERREVPTVSMVLPGITSLLERIRYRQCFA